MLHILMGLRLLLSEHINLKNFVNALVIAMGAVG